jgi:protease-4
MHLKMNGVIMGGERVIDQLKKYRKQDHIKAIVLELNSPGGVVGPSQELHDEIKRTREEFGKPVVAVSTALIASGAYYAAVAADKIVVAPGTLVGSIGVIMEFMNLEKLYDWAKVSRYSITTGKFKDSGADYREMRTDERELFQELVDDVYGQFVGAVAAGRKLDVEQVKPWADGRVFTGQKAKEIGFVDELGMVDDAHRIAAEIAGLGKNYEVVKPPSERPNLWDVFMAPEEESSMEGKANTAIENAIANGLRKAIHADLLHRPLYLMPGVF